MVYRYSWLAGLVALWFAFTQLSGLLRPTTEGVTWQVAVIAAVVLGTALTWFGLALRLPTWTVVLLNGLGMMIAITRVAAPDTSRFLLPTFSTFSTLEEQLRVAAGIIRSAIEPVLPVTGVVIVVMVVFWVVGVILAWGLMRAHPYAALIPPLVLTLQFATMNRGPSPLLEIAIFVALVAVTILAVATDERSQTVGRMVPRGTWPTSRTAPPASSIGLLGVTVVAALVSVQAFQGFAPPDGWLNWRDEQGLGGDFYGSVEYNPFVSIQQRLVNPSNTPVFQASISGDVPADQVYFQFLTMDAYNGTQFFAVEGPVETTDEFPYENPDAAFAGPRANLEATIRIERLTQGWLPSTYSVVSIAAEEDVLPNLRIRPEDSAVVYPGGLTRQGMVYRITAEVPQPDLNVLATTSDGDLSKSFAEAVAAVGDREPSSLPVPTPPAAVRDDPPNVARTLDLPDDNDDARIPEIARLARQKTAGLETDFERGLALEAWFHSPDFTYQLLEESDLGHGATSVAAWLLDPDSPFHRTGYCENFATAMAVMARTLRIPSRVVLGFTPGQQVGPDPNAVVVLDRNAHAWVELWMPSQGWVRFDPTPRGEADTPQTFEITSEDLGMDVREFLDIAIDDQLAGGGGFGDFDIPDIDLNFITDPGLVDAGEIERPGFFERAATALRWTLTLSLLIGAVPAIKWWRRRRRMARLRDGDITAAWEDIVARLDDLGEPVPENATPADVAGSVNHAMEPLADVYGRAIYGPQGTITDEHVAVASGSLDDTRAHLQERYTKLQRSLAAFRVRSLIPPSVRRRFKR